MIKPSLSAVVLPGKITNRVKVIGRNGSATRGRIPPPLRPPTTMELEEAAGIHDTCREVTFSKNLEPGRVCVALSIPASELALIDGWAAQLKVSRSRFLAMAATFYAAKVIP